MTKPSAELYDSLARLMADFTTDAVLLALQKAADRAAAGTPQQGPKRAYRAAEVAIEGAREATRTARAYHVGISMQLAMAQLADDAEEAEGARRDGGVTALAPSPEPETSAEHVSFPVKVGETYDLIAHFVLSSTPTAGIDVGVRLHGGPPGHVIRIDSEDERRGIERVEIDGSPFIVCAKDHGTPGAKPTHRSRREALSCEACHALLTQHGLL